MAEQFKRQHIVPQAYLKRFASKTSKGKFSIGMCLHPQSEEREFHLTLIDDVGFVKNIYDIEENSPKGDPKYWEHILAKSIDEYYGSFFDSIIASATLTSSNFKIINEEQRMLLARMILVQMSRVPSFINFMFNRFDIIEKDCKDKLMKHYKDIRNLHGKVVHKKDVERAKRTQFTKKEQIDSLFSYLYEQLDAYSSILCKRSWVFIYNSLSKDFPFCTSDNPVIVVDINSDKIGLGENGIAMQSTYIVYPLSPSVAIVLFPSTICPDLDCQRIVLIDKEEILNLNHYESLQAFKHFFIPPDFFNRILDIKE